MSKYQLVINSDDPNEISSLLAALGSSTAVATVQNAQTAPLSVGGAASGSTGVAHDEDDDKDGAPADPNGVDSTNLPWDDRIHSTPAQLTDKGVWRAKRGVGKNKEFVAQVEAELRNRAAAPAQQPAQTAPVQQMPQTQLQPGAPIYDPRNDPNMQTQPAQPVYQQQPQFQPAPQFPQPGQFDPNAQQQQPVYQQQPQFPQPGQFPHPQQTAQPGPGPATNVQAPTGLDFGSFMQKIQGLLATPAQGGGMMLDAPYLQTVAQHLGVQSITDIGASQALIDKAVQVMANAGRWM